ncbi:MAG: hypothetical protein KGH75_02700 [Rhodospirillales bacterium]|nr:hypothetical protein [Rhodospirillales bacterium]
MPHIYSTLANDQQYQNWHPPVPGHDSHQPGQFVVIKGGTGVANDRLITPLGVHTEVDDAQLAHLEANAVFKLHRDNGFIRVEKKKFDPEKVAASMALNDKSAPATPADASPEGRIGREASILGTEAVATLKDAN